MIETPKAPRGGNESPKLENAPLTSTAASATAKRGKHPPSKQTSSGGASGTASVSRDDQLNQQSQSSKNVSHVPCKFYKQGACQAGEECPFSHVSDIATQAVCKYYQKGTCKFGNKCALVHLTPDGKKVPKPKERKEKRRALSGQGQAQPQNTQEGQSQGAQLAQKTPAQTRHISTPLAVPSRHEGPEPVFGSPTPFSRQLSGGLSSHLGNGSLQTPPVLNESAMRRISPSTVGSIYSTQPHSGRPSFSQPAAPAKQRSISFTVSGPQSAPFQPVARADSQVFVGHLAPRSSIWSDRPLGPLAFEGSAIVDDDDDQEEGFEEDLVPSALSDLLTPAERQRRNSRHSLDSTNQHILTPPSTDLWAQGSLSQRRFSGPQPEPSIAGSTPIGPPRSCTSSPPDKNQVKSINHRHETLIH